MAIFSFDSRGATARSQLFDQLAHWLFRLGFASIFLVNAAYAAIHPEDFTSLLKDNFIATMIGHADQLVMITMFNDLFIGTLILVGVWKKYVYAWAGGWLLLVAGLKLMNLVF